MSKGVKIIKKKKSKEQKNTKQKQIINLHLNKRMNNKQSYLRQKNTKKKWKKN